MSGEIFVQKNCAKYVICRAGWMMGSGPKKDKKFVNKIINQISNGHKDLYVVNDKMGTPTYTIDFAKNVELLISKEYWGVYNMVCKGITSRFEVAKRIIKILGMENDIKLNAVSSEYFSKEYYAPRPLSERLLTKKLDLRSINIMQPWEKALEIYLNEYYYDIFK